MVLLHKQFETTCVDVILDISTILTHSSTFERRAQFIAYTEHNETIYHCKVVQAAKWTIDHYKSCREKPQKTLLTKPTKMSLT